MQISLSPLLKSKLPDFNFFWAEIKGVEITPSCPELIKIFEEERFKLLNDFSLEDLKNQENILKTRRAFKILGIDPSRYRPSQESLMRRIFLNKDISFINNAVDLVNLLSIKYRLAMGIYDKDKIKGQLVIREGRADEEFLALNSRVVNCKNKIVLTDSEGVVGSAYVDSQRTNVDLRSKNLIHIIYLVPAEFREDFSWAKNLFFRFLRGEVFGYYKVV